METEVNCLLKYEAIDLFLVKNLLLKETGWLGGWWALFLERFLRSDQKRLGCIHWLALSNLSIQVFRDASVMVMAI